MQVPTAHRQEQKAQIEENPIVEDVHENSIESGTGPNANPARERPKRYGVIPFVVVIGVVCNNRFPKSKMER